MVENNLPLIINTKEVGKEKLKRFKDNESFDNIFQPKFDEIFRTSYFMKGKWAKDYFKNDSPIVLELGCGKGEYTVALARKNMNINYIGIDVKGARLWRGAKTAHEEQIKNVAFVRISIELIESIFAEDEVSEIWLTFSDPQPKRAKKRLSSSNFLNKYKNFVKNNAPIHIKTDNKMLYDYSRALALENKFKINYSSQDVYNDNNLPSEIKEVQTFYEQQFLAQNMTINYLEYHINNQIDIIEPADYENINTHGY